MITFINPCHARQGRSNASVQNISLLLNGDSLIADISGDSGHVATLTSLLSLNGVHAQTITNIAQGGTTLTHAAGQDITNWWDERTDIKGNRYVNRIDPVVDKDTYTDIIISLGTNDHNDAYGALSLSELIDDYSNYIDQLKVDFPSLARIFIAPMCRHSYSLNDDQWQLMRDAQYGLVDARSDCYILPEFYDLALSDTVHLNDASVTKRSERYAARMANVISGSGKPTLGMEITDAVMDDQGCLCTITHHDGSDFVIPDSDVAKQLFRAESDGAYVDLSNHIVTKISNNQIRIEGAPWNAPTLQTVWGTMGLIAGDSPDFGANIEPNVPHDNSALELPFMHSKVTPADTDVIRSIDNLAYEVRPSYAKIFDSGNDVQSIQSLNGKTLSNLNAGQFMTYDASAFDGAGGLRSTSLSTILTADNGFPSQETLMIGITVDVPDTVSGNGYLFAFGTSNVISTQAQFYINSAGQIRYSTNEANGQDIIGGDLRGGRHAIIFNFTAFDNCDVYVNDAATPLASFDPRNSYAFQNDLMFGGGQDGVAFGQLFAKIGAHDPTNDPSLNDIMSDMKTRFGLTL